MGFDCDDEEDKDKEEECEADARFFPSITFLLVVGVILVLVTMLTSVFAFLCRTSACCEKALAKLKEKLLWNAFIRYSLQSYLKLAFANI